MTFSIVAKKCACMAHVRVLPIRKIHLKEHCEIVKLCWIIFTRKSTVETVICDFQWDF